MDIPAEMRTKCLEEPPPSLALWQLLSEKKQHNTEETELEQFSEIRPGIFFSDNLDGLHFDFLREGRAPFVQLSALLKKNALVWQLPPEKNGIENYPLYHWTKSVIDDPKKQEKHSRSFTIYMGGAAVYSEEGAQDLMAALKAVAKGKNIHVQMVDTDPSKNPQPPAEFTGSGDGQAGGT